MTRQHPNGPALRSSAAALGAALVTLPLLAAAADAPSVTVGAGMRTSFSHTDLSSSTDATDATLDSARLYINGSVTDQIKFTVNTEYTGDSTDTLILMDAIARFEFSDKVNIWAGRLLPPSDRSNLYGPYYANNWKVYIDGVQDMWPNIAVGRDNGIVYWGQFGKVKLSAGAFDVPQTLGNSKTNAFKADALWAGRAQLDLWDPEGGYYQNGTYYGEKDLLAFGAAVQGAGDYTAYSADLLVEKKLMGAGAVGLEAEYYKQKIDPTGSVNDRDYDGWYALVHYLFPQEVGIGKFQLLLKSGAAGTDSFGTTKMYDTKTTEFDLNYIMKSFNARASLFYTNQKSDAPGSYAYKTFGLGLQLQM